MSIKLHIQHRGFQYCCGLDELGEFPYTLQEVKDENYDFGARKGAKVTRATLIAAIRAQLQGRHTSSRPLIVTTIPKQRIAIEALKAEGFKPLKTFKNPNTQAKVTLWFKQYKKGTGGTIVGDDGYEYDDIY